MNAIKLDRHNYHTHISQMTKSLIVYLVDYPVTTEKRGLGFRRASERSIRPPSHNREKESSKFNKTLFFFFFDGDVGPGLNESVQ